MQEDLILTWYVLLDIVDNAGRPDIDFGREGLLIDDSSFFGH